MCHLELHFYSILFWYHCLPPPPQWARVTTSTQTFLVFNCTPVFERTDQIVRDVGNDWSSQPEESNWTQSIGHLERNSKPLDVHLSVVTQHTDLVGRVELID